MIPPSTGSPRKAACSAAAAAITSRWRARLIGPSAATQGAGQVAHEDAPAVAVGLDRDDAGLDDAGRRCRTPAFQRSAVIARPPTARPSQSPPGTTCLAIPGVPSGSVTRSSVAPLLPPPRLAGAIA